MNSWFAGNHKTDTDCPSRTAYLAELAQLRAAGLRTTSRRVKPFPSVEPAKGLEAGAAMPPRISGDCREYVPTAVQFGRVPVDTSRNGAVPAGRIPMAPVFGASREYCEAHHICVVCGGDIPEELRKGRTVNRITCSTNCATDWTRRGVTYRRKRREQERQG